MKVKFIELVEGDLAFVKEIYDYYTLHTTVVYFLNPVPVEQIRSFLPIGDPVYRSYIMENETGERVGFCYFSKFRPREAFKISVEVTIYLKPEYAGKGYGHEAIEFLEEQIKAGGFCNIMALVAGENKPSIRLFERHNYVCCAHIQRVAEKFGNRLDLKMYQKELEQDPT